MDNDDKNNKNDDNDNSNDIEDDYIFDSYDITIVMIMTMIWIGSKV